MSDEMEHAGYATEQSIEAARKQGRMDAMRERAPLVVSVEDIGECLRDLGTMIIQGVDSRNESKRKGIAIGLRRAAHRIQYGNLDQFSVDDRPDPAPLYDMIRLMWKALERREPLNAAEYDSLQALVKEILPKEGRTKTME